MSWSIDHEEHRFVAVARRGVRRLLGFDFVHAWRNRRGLGAADVVWTHTEWESLAAVSVLWLLRNRTTQVIAQSVWLWDDWSRHSIVKRRLHLALLQRAAVEITLSDANRKVARRVRRSDDVLRVPFGAAVNPVLGEEVLLDAPPRSKHVVLAVGNDRHRDWATLHAAARQMPGTIFRVATLSPRYPREDAPENVQVEPVRSLSELYGLYATSGAVVLPLVENMHASGCTTAIEAQWFGCPLVTADVGGLGLYLGDEGVHLYEPRSARSLADALQLALADRAQTDFRERQQDFLVRSGLTAEDYVARYVLLTSWLVDGTPNRDLAERLVSVRDALTAGTD
jgi:glycosyltransferase involved in cell wall biosynthesis